MGDESGRLAKVSSELIEVAGKRIIIVRGDEPIALKANANDLVSLAYEHDAHLLVLDEGALGSEFLDLRSGVAGEVLQKLTNYHLVAAAILPDEIAQGGRFGELMLEMNRGSRFRSFPTFDEAVQWLVQQE